MGVLAALAMAARPGLRLRTGARRALSASATRSGWARVRPGCRPGSISLLARRAVAEPSGYGKVILILTMWIGRVRSMTFVVALFARNRSARLAPAPRAPRFNHEVFRLGRETQSDTPMELPRMNAIASRLTVAGILKTSMRAIFRPTNTRTAASPVFR